ncbi:unnamed protein product [Brassica rapa]|uniref:Uncharacterized protein n=2 Tax=Brassica TaxID=3705 RepID=A0A8D9DDH2_BRACM|nr:unnamed protein product [Brassica napus]CAG7875257.1 unnamed protein product [Brassica rapa]
MAVDKQWRRCSAPPLCCALNSWLPSPLHRNRLVVSRRSKIEI